MNKADALFDKIIKMKDGMIIFDDGEVFDKDNSMVILGATDEDDGYTFISSVLEKLYPGYTTIGQSLIHEADKVFDVIKITSGGVEHEMWFDITEFFGKK
jgi:hypothetical protein